MFLDANKVLKKYSRLFQKITLTIFFSMQSLLASAAEESDIENLTEYNGGMNLDGMMQVLTALITVILVIFLLSMLMKKFNMVPGGNSGMIKIVSGLALNSKDRLLLVQVGDEQVLLGVTQGNITKLHQMQNAVLENTANVVANNEKSKFSKLLESINTGNKS